MLFRYQMRAILRRLILTWPALALVYLAFYLGDEGWRLAASLGWQPVLAAALLHLPLVGVQVLPPALLLAALLALGRLRQSGELEAMRLAGASPSRVLWPLLVSGLLSTGAAFLLGELVSPPCERSADRRLGVTRASPLTGEGPPSGWLRQGRWFLQLTPLTSGRARLLGLEHDGHYQVRRELEGELDGSGRLRPLRPAAADGPPAADARAAAPLAALARLGLDRASLEELRARPETLGTASLMRRVERLRASGRARPAEELLLQARFAFPALNLLVVLIAWHLALRGRERPLLPDLLLALLWLLGLWLLLALGWLLARAGWISPVYGAWLPLLAGLLLAGLLQQGASAASRFSARRAAELGRHLVSR